MTTPLPSGVTLSERYLAKLCQRSFLRLWSYPNLFRDQKAGKNGKGDGKELSDLIVICGDDIIIFSDKSCAYPNTGKPDLDWCRWFRRSIEKSVNQVIGAEGWLRDAPERIYLDRACTQKLPITIPRGPQVRIHRIVVALNAGKRCKQELGGSGSLMLMTQLVGKDNYTTRFAVGVVEPKKRFVHVFDDVTLDIVLRELDTITDFVRYLSEKEKLLTSRPVIATGEENLLALYLKETNKDRQHYFPVPDETSGILIPDGGWHTLQTLPQFLAKKLADRDSYLWDQIIEEVSRHALSGTLENGGDNVSEVERALRFMVCEPRIARRIFSKAMNQMRAMTGPGQANKRCMESIQWPSTGYIFMYCHWDGKNEAEYRRRRLEHLHNYAIAYAHVHREYARVIGIASEAGTDERSTDLIVLEGLIWTPEREAEVERMRAAMNWQNPDRIIRSVVETPEYPSVIDSRMALENLGLARRSAFKVGRNEACPCGSGLKYKKCCSRA
jgi:hypothetical protein